MGSGRVVIGMDPHTRSATIDVRMTDLRDRPAGLLHDPHRTSTEVRIEPSTYLGHNLSSSARSTRAAGAWRDPGTVEQARPC